MTLISYTMQTKMQVINSDFFSRFSFQSVSHITSIRVLVIFLFYDLHLFRHYIAFVIVIVINVKWISALICLVFLMQGCCFIIMKLLRTAITQLINKHSSQQFLMSSHKLLLTNKLAKIFQMKYNKNVFGKQTAKRCWLYR